MSQSSILIDTLELIKREREGKKKEKEREK
jgi:hypothetical protein